jgi:hypothetical protein
MGRCSTRLRLVSGVILACAVLAAVALWQTGCGAPRVKGPKDEELIATFYAHRQAFEHLQEMAAEDARRGWYLGASNPSALDQSRRSEYNNLKSQIRPVFVAMNGNTGVVRFIFAYKGSAIGPRYAKGVEYVPGDYSREGVLLPDLNGPASLPANVYIREIEPGRLIFYQRDE